MSAIQRLVIVGVGLIGGSLARALRADGFQGEIVGAGRSEANLARAVELGVIDRYAMDLGEAARDADVVMVCVPLSAMRSVFEALRPAYAAGAVITDAGSAKGCVVADARAVFGEVPPRLVPGHPIAGTERSGVEASFATLFRDRRVILTPVKGADLGAVDTVTRLWQQAGASVVEMDVAHHDEVLAATSHLPHLLAYGLVDTLSRWEGVGEIFEFAAGGFRDFTRIASSDPVMWRDICFANRASLVAALQRYRQDLDELIAMLEADDRERIEQVFRNAKTTRDAFVERLEGRRGDKDRES